MTEGRLQQAIASLFPGYFALVMATGIVSVAADLTAIPWVAEVLLAVNVPAYVVLWGLTVARLARYPRRMLDDLNHHGRSPGFFTLVAGTCVLGSQVLILTGETGVAWALWILGILLWTVLMYAFFTAVTVAANKPSLESGINGAWLIAIVATQSISILGALLAPELSPGLARQVQLFFSLCMYLVGSLLYIPVITLILFAGLRATA